MELTVKLVSGEGRVVRVSTGATVGELRRAVAQSFGEPVERVRLSTANANDIRPTTLDNDSAPLSSFGLSHGSALMLLLRLLAVTQVIVKNEKGQNKTYDVGEEETVVQLQRKIYNKDGVPEDQQRLIHNGRQMEAGRKLKDYNVTNGSIIYLTLRLRGG
ncbi:uncharacterized protein LOC111191383 [Astyanax mexicanus]|uniref:uncharacterized protein LOC111191383 n=1 Tax=Astyanax mexicanus TaxID=7994 RepID=UPI0020CB07E0|nr:uncharacterized protein LOC111191383 [Astyanax mexicanus]